MCFALGCALTNGRGKGTMEVEELPEVYVITEYRRTEKGGVSFEFKIAREKKKKTKEEAKKKEDD